MFKKVIGILLIMCMVFLLASCGVTKGETPEQAITNLIAAYKAVDSAQLIKYLGTDKAFDSTEQSLKDAETTKIMLDKLSCKVLSSSIDGEKATVKAEITSKDLKSIFQAYAAQALPITMANAFKTGSDKLSDEQIQEQIQDILMTLLKDKDAKTATQTVTLSLTKNGDSWKVTNSEELQDAVTGGMMSYVNNLNDSLGSTSSEPQTDDDKLSEVRDYVVMDIWGKGFCDISWYISNGTNSTGETMDIDFTLQQLTDAMAKKSGYDTFITGLTDKKYDGVKQVWAKLSPEIDKLYNQVKSKKPTAKDDSYNFDTGLFKQYEDTFTDKVDELTK